LPILQKLLAVYKQWQSFIHHLPKQTRYTLGEKIDLLFIEVFELIITARYLPQNQKLPMLQRASLKLDILKFFLQVAWEIKTINTKQYILLSKSLDEIGKIIGGWQKQAIKTPPSDGE
jgi:hypothetical protein